MNEILRPSLVELCEPLDRPLALPEHAYSVLKRRILICDLVPNQRLIETNLCNGLNISRTPLREALNRLSNEELVNFQPRSGYRVASITIRGFQNLIELRNVVEPQAAALAAVRAKPADVARLRASAKLAYDPSDDSSFVDYCRANARFHLCLVRAAGNPLLENIVMSALDLYQRPTYLRIGRQMEPGNPTGKHEALAEAVACRDADAAQSIMRRHIQGGGERILAALKNAGYGYSDDDLGKGSITDS
jgi:DNA-binding GntR family transcriptional regulator